MSTTDSRDFQQSWDPLEEHERCRETSAALVLSGSSLDPQRITETLEIEPNDSWSLGEAFRSTHSGAEGRRVTGIWELSSRNMLSSTSLERHILNILDRLEGKEERLQQLVRDMGLLMRIVCFWVSAVGHDGPMLSPKLLRRVADIGAILWIDFYDGSAD